MTSVENLVITPHRNLSLFDYGLTFDKGLGQIRADGYDRYLTPQEYICALAEAKKGTRKDLEFLLKRRNNFWLGMALRVHGSALDIALHPENLSWGHRRYIIQNMSEDLQCSERRTFNFDNKGNRNILSLEIRNLPEEILEFILGIDYEDIFHQLGTMTGRDSDMGLFYLPNRDGEFKGQWMPFAVTQTDYFVLGPSYYSDALGARQKIPDVTTSPIKIISENTVVKNWGHTYDYVPEKDLK